MADTAFQKVYREEFIAAFEINETRVRGTTVTEADVNGNEAVFLVAGSGGATAVTRGVNGLIPSRPDDLTQLTATLREWHDLTKRTRFNVMSSQGNARRIMQMTTVGVLNRKIDEDIITELATATVTAGAAAQASLSMVAKAKAILGNADVPVQEEDNLFGLVTPGFQAYLEQIPEWSSADYIESKPLVGPTRIYRRWMGVNWIMHPNLPGVGTASETCFMYHRNSIGHAMQLSNLDLAVGYDDEQAYSWARASQHMGSKLLQNSGVVKMLHDGSAFA
jgi:hypothetical protein